MTKFYTNKWTQKWEESFLLGNGHLGVIVEGQENKEIITGSHHNNFLTTNNMLEIPRLDKEKLKLKNKIKYDGYDEAISYFFSKARQQGYKGLTMSDIVHPSFKLMIEHLNNYDVKTYYQSIDTKDRLINIKDKNCNLEASLLNKNKIVLEYKSNIKKNSIVYFNNNHDDLFEENIEKNSDIHLIKKNIYLDGTYVKNKIKITTDGSVTNIKNKMHIKGHKKMIVTIKSEYIGNQLKNRKSDSENTLNLEFKSKKEYNLETINFDDDSIIFLNAFYEKTRYYIDSYGGEGIPGLQGIWAGDFNPAWSGDYTFDTNVQLAISSFASMGKFDSLLSVFDHIENYLDDFKKNALYYYGCRGILVPVHASTTGLHVHWNEEWPLIFWTSGAGWLAHYYNEYFDYTLDLEFLRNRAVPYYEEALQFYIDYALKDKKIEVSPGYSAENGMGDNPTMDIAVIKELIKNLDRSYELLNIDSKKRLDYKRLHKYIPEYRITDGIVNEWLDERSKENFNHRHFSHFYPVFVSKEINYKHKNYEAFVNTFIKKTKYWLLNDKQDTSSSHGKIHAGMIAISLELDEIFDSSIESLFKNKAHFKNLISAHYNNESIFNIDATGSFLKLVHDSLIYSESDGSLTIGKIKSKYLKYGKLYNIWLPKKIFINKIEWNWEEGSVFIKLRTSENQNIIINYLDKTYVLKNINGQVALRLDEENLKEIN